MWGGGGGGGTPAEMLTGQPEPSLAASTHLGRNRMVVQQVSSSEA